MHHILAFYFFNLCQSICHFNLFSSIAQVGQLREVSNKAHNAELKLFLEVELGPVNIVYLFFFSPIFLFLLNFEMLGCF